MTDAMDKTEAGPSPDTRPEMPAAPAALASMSAADLDWVENWLIQKRGTEHAARPYGKGSLLLTTLIFEVRRERRHRNRVRTEATALAGDNMAARREALSGYEDHPGYGHALHGGTGERQGVYAAPSETQQPKRGGRTGVIVGLGLPLLITAAVVAGLMWWHTGGVLPQ
jgi:hypothetical protein